MIYRGIATAGIVAMVAMLVLFFRNNLPELAKYLPQMAGRIKFLRLVAYFLVLSCFLLLGFSSILPIIAGSDHLSGSFV